MNGAQVRQPVTVRPVTSRRDRSRFLDFQYAHYDASTQFVPEVRRDVAARLNPKKNPFFEHGDIQPFLAEDVTGNVVGRIAAVRNGMHLEKYADGVGFFGFYECVEDASVSRALLDAAATWLREQGLTAMRGPANPSLNDVAGLLVNGFDRFPFIMMPYNHLFYKDQLEAYGFQRVMTMWAYYAHYKYVDTDKLIRGIEIIKRRNPGLTLREMDITRFDEEAERVLDIYNRAWSKNWGHVPMTPAEFAHLAKEMKQIVDPRLVFFAELNGEPIGFSLSLPNTNRWLKGIKGGRLFPTGLLKILLRATIVHPMECRNLLMGVVPEHQSKGIYALLNATLIRRAPELGYEAGELSWVLDSNHAMKNALEAQNSVIDKEYAMYEVAL